jgi:hypothetical protein
VGCELTWVKTGCQKMAPHRAGSYTVLTRTGLDDSGTAQDSCRSAQNDRSLCRAVETGSCREQFQTAGPLG